MKIREGDQILIIKGKDKGRKGKVLRGFPKESKILVEGMNIKKKSRKPKKEGQKGQVVEISAPIPISRAKLICPKCKKPVKVSYKKKSKTSEQDERVATREELSLRTKDRIEKVRVCKKCGEEI